MADSPDESLLARLESRAGDALERVRTLLEESTREVPRRLERFAESLADPNALADPERLERFQRVAEFATRTVYGLGFSVDPDARLLFEYIDWAERRRGRAAIFEIFRRHNPVFRPDFVRVIEAARRTAVPGETTDGDLADALERYRRSARRDALRFLAALGSTDATRGPSTDDLDELEARVRSSEMPPRFEPLLDRILNRRRSGREADDPRTPDPEGLGDQVRALVRKRVGFDRQLQFLSVGFLFATQGFMTRTALENLPEMIRKVASEDDVIDV